MKLTNPVTTNPWLFGGLSALPCCLLIGIITVFFHAGPVPTRTALPDWTWYMVFSVLPLWVTVIGFVLAYTLSLLLDKLSWLQKKHSTRVYLILFALAWNPVFIFLSLFTFAMGFGCGPEPTSMQQLTNRLTGIICFGLPLATFISLAICGGAITFLIVISESIAWNLSKSNSVNT